MLFCHRRCVVVCCFDEEMRFFLRCGIVVWFRFVCTCLRAEQMAESSCVIAFFLLRPSFCGVFRVKGSRMWMSIQMANLFRSLSFPATITIPSDFLFTRIRAEKGEKKANDFGPLLKPWLGTFYEYEIYLSTKTYPVLSSLTYWKFAGPKYQVCNVILIMPRVINQ